MKKRFALPLFDPIEKELEVSTADFRMLIDFDDVDHYVVEELTKLAVAALNAIPETDWKAAIKRGRIASEAEM